MTYAVGQPIAAADYQIFRGAYDPATAYPNSASAVNAIAAIVGVGYADRGYGLASVALPAAAAGSVVSSATWNSLFAAMNLINIQTGSGLGLPATVTPGTAIQALIGGSLPSLPSLITTLDNNRASYSPSQMGLHNELTSTRTTSWTGVVTHEFVQTFTDEDSARFFYNTGGKILLSGSRTGGTSSQLDSAFSDLLSAMGIIQIGGHSTAYTGTGGITYPIGYFNLTSTYQTLFIHYGSAYGFTGVGYLVKARVENVLGINGGNGTVVRVQAIFSTTAAQPFTTSLVDGTLVSTVEQLVADSLGVVSPTYQTITEISVGGTSSAPVTTAGSTSFTVQIPAHVSGITDVTSFSVDYLVGGGGGGGTGEEQGNGGGGGGGGSGGYWINQTLACQPGDLITVNIGPQSGASQAGVDTVLLVNGVEQLRATGGGAGGNASGGTPGGGGSAGYPNGSSGAAGQAGTSDTSSGNGGDGANCGTFGVGGAGGVQTYGSTGTGYGSGGGGGGFHDRTSPYSWTGGAGRPGEASVTYTPGVPISNGGGSTSGYLYVANNENQYVPRISSTGTVESQWATITNIPPYPIADIQVDAAGNIYTYNNSQIKKLTSTGTTVWTVNLTTLNGPTAIVVDTNGNVYTVNGDRTHLAQINASGVLNATWASLGTGGIWNSVGIDASNNIYVFQSSSASQIAKVNASTATVQIITIPIGISITDGSYTVDPSGNVFMSSVGGGSIVKLSSAGTFTPQWATLANFESRLYSDPNGNIWTVDRTTGILYKLSTAGVVAATYQVFPLLTNAFSGFLLPSIAFDSTGNVYVADYASNSITKVSTSGVLQQWAFLSSGAQVYSIAINYNTGTMYTANNGWIFNTVDVITSAGSISSLQLGSYSSQVIGYGNYQDSVVVDSQGNVYVLGALTRMISKISPSGAVTQIWANLGANGASVNTLVIDSADNIYSYDSSVGYVYKITPAGVVSIVYQLPAGQNYNLFLDSSNNLYWFDPPNRNNAIWRNGGVVAQLSTQITGLAIDSLYNIYVSHSSSNSISKISSSGVVTDPWVTLSSGTYPGILRMDTSNNLYSMNYNSGNYTISKITQSGTVTQTWATLGSSASTPYDIKLDQSSNLYVLCNKGLTAGTIFKITPAGVVTPNWATLAANSDPQQIALNF